MRPITEKILVTYSKNDDSKSIVAGESEIRRNQVITTGKPSEWPSRIILWLSRRYHLISSYFTLSGDDTFTVIVLAVCDEDFFHYWSHESLLEYVRRIVK